MPILVVDDHPENRTALRAILSSPDYRIVEAGSGAEALLRLLEEDFAVLLIDVVMPDMSGFELAAAIKERERTAAIPIVFLTGQATDVDLVHRGYRVGAVDYLIKPLVPEMVRAKVAVFAQLFREKAKRAAGRAPSRGGTERKRIPPDRAATRQRAALPCLPAGGSPHRLDRSPGRNRGLLQSALVRIHGPFGGAGSRFLAWNRSRR